ncbi:LOW QUALITY PROTEIN: ras-interacting protein 1, partial [Cyanocitta cristata]
MLPEERKEGSPRFGKLHFPVGLWINSPKKRLAKMSRRWPSAGSVRSTSSDTPSRASDPSDPRPAAPAPPKPKPPRHKRLSHLFHRTSATVPPVPPPRAAAGPARRNSPSSTTPRGDILVSPNPQQPPSILKIFGGAISRGANYKSVLATPRSSARQLVREALERYGLNPDDFGQFALCDVVGRPGGGTATSAGGWQGEHLREVGDWERPLVLQELWKPKAGWSRRFEIRRRQELDRAGGHGTMETPRVSGDSPQSGALGVAERLATTLERREWPLGLLCRQPRSRGSAPADPRQCPLGGLAGGGGDSTGTPPAGPPGPSGTPPDTGTPPGDGSPSLELLSQCLIQPPRDRPYFLLLRGLRPLHHDPTPTHLRPPRKTGGGGNPETPPATPENPETPQKSDLGPFSVVDTFLSAPDILPRHCLVQATPGWGGSDPNGDPPSATVRPFRGAAATLNGSPLLRRAALNPGDLLGLGEHVLLLYKDPRIGRGRDPRGCPPPRASLGVLGVLGCAGCGRSPQERRDVLRVALETPKAELRYRPQDEGTLLRGNPKRGFGGGFRGGVHGGRFGGFRGGFGGFRGGFRGSGPRVPFGVVLGTRGSRVPGGAFPGAAGESGRDAAGDGLGEDQGNRGPAAREPPDGDPPPALDLAGVTSDLRPLLLWLANAVELLNLAQGHVLAMEKELDIEGPCPELERDLESCDEALGVLDEVIMSTFQQSVYNLTKTLYSALPALLDTNPFVGPGEPRAGPDLGGVPEGLRPPLAVFGAVLGLTRDCHLHPDLVSQTFGYLFFFCNASLFNALMEKGSAGPFFQWWVGVRLRTNLDLVLDGLGALGLGDIAGDFFRKLSATANLLCTPRGCLEQVGAPGDSWG